MSDRELTASFPRPITGDRPEGKVVDDGRWVGRGFAAALRDAARGGWSGVFELSSGNLLAAGTAVLAKGHLAWATSMHQPETLGSFLHRLGHVSRDELDIAQALFEENKGETKLGRLLEEAGIIPRQVLRRCILLHVRLAVSSLLQRELEVVAARAGQYCVEQEMLFSLEEILPEWGSTTAACNHATGPRDAITVVLEGLKKVPGHRGCLVADRDGNTISSRGFSVSAIPGPTVLATTAVTLLESSTNAATWSSLGTVDYASSEGTDGALLAHWLDLERSLLAAVLLDTTGKVGIARHELTAAASAFAKHRPTSTRNGS